jgi:hypothetical protein
MASMVDDGDENGGHVTYDEVLAAVPDAKFAVVITRLVGYPRRQDIFVLGTYRFWAMAWINAFLYAKLGTCLQANIFENYKFRAIGPGATSAGARP